MKDNKEARNLMSNMMKHGSRWAIMVAVVILLMNAAVAQVQGATNPFPNLDDFNMTDYFPLQEGNSWTYHVDLKECTKDPTVVSESSTLVMKVSKVYKQPGYTLVTITGNPLNADAKESFGYLLYSHNVYFVPGELLPGFVEFAANGGASVREYQDDLSLKFTFPLFKGQRILGDAYPMAVIRGDNLYVPYVDLKPASAVKGLELAEGWPVYSVQDSTAGDNFVFEFVPSIGITYVSYSHNGTLYEYRCTLEEYAINGQTHKITVPVRRS